MGFNVYKIDVEKISVFIVQYRKKLMERTRILFQLKSLGFIDTGKKGLGGHHRIIHAKISRGSLYVGNQYISGTGEYAEIKNSISPSSLDRKGYSEWRNNNTGTLLDFLGTWIK